MKLKRCGSQKFHGWTDLFEEKRVNMSWDEQQNKLVLTVRGVQDVASSSSLYDYEVILGIDEIRSILDLLSKEALAKSDSVVGGELAGATHALLRLLLSASGMVPQVQAQE